MSSVHEKWICPPWGQSPWKKETAGHIFCFRARYLLRFSRRQGLCSSVYFKFCKHKSVKLQSVLLFFKFLLALRFLRLGWSMNISHNLFWLWLMACSRRCCGKNVRIAAGEGKKRSVFFSLVQVISYGNLFSGLEFPSKTWPYLYCHVFTLIKYASVSNCGYALGTYWYKKNKIAE